MSHRDDGVGRYEVDMLMNGTCTVAASRQRK